MKRHYIFKPQIAFLPMLTILFACSQSPEEAGKDLAQKKYECQLIKVTDDVIGLKKQLSDLKAGKFKSQIEFSRSKADYQAPSESYLENSKNCDDDLNRLGEEIGLKFPRPDDRQTVRNSFNSHYKILERDLFEKSDAIENEIKKEKDKLPLR